MTGEEHQEIINQIAQNLGDQIKVTELLGKLKSDYTEVLTQSDKYKTSYEEVQTKYNVALEKNMELFLQVGSATNQSQTEQGQPEDGQKEEDTKLKYEDLFNEEGELK